VRCAYYLFKGKNSLDEKTACNCFKNRAAPLGEPHRPFNSKSSPVAKPHAQNNFLTSFRLEEKNDRWAKPATKGF
jgi:hypothetical protein